jgi:hypothetical protein
MRILMLWAWLAGGAVFMAWHYGPGQDQLALDDARQSAKQAAAAAEKGEWGDVVQHYEAALVRLPAGHERLAQTLRLDRAKARMHVGQLPEARSELGALVDELQSPGNANRELLAEAQQALANAQYYVTWLLRLEGEPAAVWEPEIESARQLQRMLAENSEQKGESADATGHREDLEATIRLARMDLSELQALNLPSQCCGCKAGACKGACRKPGKSKNPGNSPPDGRGAGLGPPPDGSGH